MRNPCWPPSDWGNPRASRVTCLVIPVLIYPMIPRAMMPHPIILRNVMTRPVTPQVVMTHSLIPQTSVIPRAARNNRLISGAVMPH